jgi:hypothetical protein
MKNVDCGLCGNQHSGMLALYTQLLRPFKEADMMRNGGLTCVPAFVGPQYGGDFRPMLVGRSVNGWDMEWTGTAHQMAKQALKMSFNFDEITDPDAYRKNPDFYNFNRCSFIQTGLAVLKKMGMEEEKVSTSFVWSNLYKVVPAISGNPSGKIQHMQRETAIQILEEEIREFRPTHIIFFTDVDWMQNTWRNSETETSFRKIFAFNETDVFGKYVKAVDKYHGEIPFVVCVRPENKPREEMACQIVKAFHSLT